MSKFKELLSFLESNNNTNTEHPVVTYGPNKGTSAMGEYGLMPRTAQDLAKQRNDDELDKIVQKADPKNVEEILTSNPDRYEEYVDQMVDKVKMPSIRDAALKWQAGQNADQESIDRLKGSDRDNKIEQFLNESDDNYSRAPEYTDQFLEEPYKPPILYNKIRDRLNMRFKK